MVIILLFLTLLEKVPLKQLLINEFKKFVKNYSIQTELHLNVIMFLNFLIEKAKNNLDNCSHGICNIVEEFFLNSLGFYCFENQLKKGQTVVFNWIYVNDTVEI